MPLDQVHHTPGVASGSQGLAEAHQTEKDQITQFASLHPQVRSDLEMLARKFRAEVSATRQAEIIESAKGTLGRLEGAIQVCKRVV